MITRDLAAMARRRRGLTALRRVHAAVATDLTRQSSARKAPSPLRSHSFPPKKRAA